MGVVYQKQRGNVQSCSETLIAGSAFQGCCTQVYYIQWIFIFSLRGGDYIQRGQFVREQLTTSNQNEEVSVGETRSLKQLTALLSSWGEARC